jgi:hypothetical protein
MNNTKTLTAIAAIFIATTLVVGIGTFTTTTTTQSAYAYQKKGGGDNGKGNGNGNTVTIEECKNRGSASGFDTSIDQECENLICTHPGENATCTQEGAVAAAQTPVTPVKLTCEQCFTKFLTTAQITILLRAASVSTGIKLVNLKELCAALPTIATEPGFVDFLVNGNLGLLNQQHFS